MHFVFTDCVIRRDKTCMAFHILYLLTGIRGELKPAWLTQHMSSLFSKLLLQHCIINEYPVDKAELAFPGPLKEATLNTLSKEYQ